IICRNSKMIFIIILSTLWLKKKYYFLDYITVILISLSIFFFSMATMNITMETTINTTMETWFTNSNTIVNINCIYIYIYIFYFIHIFILLLLLLLNRVYQFYY